MHVVGNWKFVRGSKGGEPDAQTPVKSGVRKTKKAERD